MVLRKCFYMLKNDIEFTTVLEKDAIRKKQNLSQYKDYKKAINLGYWNEKMKYCEDITDKWLGLKSDKVNNIIIHNNNEWFTYKGKQYFIDGKDIVIEYKIGELDFAKKLSELTDKRIEMFPKFNKPANIKSIDSKIGREYIDFKLTISGTDKFIYSNITNSNHQSNNYIFYIQNQIIPNIIVEFQIDECFRRLKYLKKVGVYHKGKFKMYKKRTFDE